MMEGKEKHEWNGEIVGNSGGASETFSQISNPKIANWNC